MAPSAFGVHSMRTVGAAPTKASTTVPSGLAAGLAASPGLAPGFGFGAAFSAGTSGAAIIGWMFTFTPDSGISTRHRLTGACGASSDTLFWPGALVIALEYSSTSSICLGSLPFFSTSSL